MQLHIIMKTEKILFLLLSMTLSFQVLSWGQTGHRITGAIAEHYLTPQAQKAVNDLLVNEDMAEASTYFDEMKSNQSDFWQKTASPWHYVNVHKGKTYEQEGAPPEGDGVTALKMYSKMLKDPKTSIEDKKLALKFIIHIVGDLHQPFHTGTSEDHGGNKVKLNLFWQDTTLHRIWDEDLIDHQLLSYSEWTDWLCKKITDKQVQQWQTTDPKVWIAEGVKLRLSLYPKKEKLSWNYQYQNLPIIKQRLEQAGVRLAFYLNELFKS